VQGELASIPTARTSICIHTDTIIYVPSPHTRRRIVPYTHAAYAACVVDRDTGHVRTYTRATAGQLISYRSIAKPTEDPSRSIDRVHPVRVTQRRRSRRSAARRRRGGGGAGAARRGGARPARAERMRPRGCTAMRLRGRARSLRRGPQNKDEREEV
jgi:hypothetical protein